MVRPPLLMHPLYELLADVAREVQVDVWNGPLHLVVQKAVQREAELEGVDVREADQVADEHRYRRAPASAGRALLQRYLGVAKPHLDHDLARHLDDVVVDQEEARQAVLFHQAQLLRQPLLHLRGDGPVPAHGRLVAELPEVGLRRVPVRHRIVGEAVAQVLRQIEPATLRQPDRVLDGLGAAVEQGGHLRMRLEVELAVGPALPVRLFQGLVVAYCDKRVLKPVAAGLVVVRVVGGDYPDSHAPAQVHQPPVAARVSIDQVLLQLDQDVFRSEPLDIAAKQTLCLLGAPLRYQVRELAAAASRQQDDALGVLGDVLRVELRVSPASIGVGSGEKVRDVAVPLLRLRQERDVGAAL